MNFAERMRRTQKRHERRQTHMWPCDFLEREFYERSSTLELYDTPWDEKARVVFFHSDQCEEAYCRSGSFDYMECEACYRTICEQNPVNGWHVQFRTHAELGYICLKCYEKEILENGQPRSDFEGAGIRGGMFFSWRNTEAIDAGFAEVDEFKNYFVPDHSAARAYNTHAMSLIDLGHKVITGLEAMAIGNLEGYITMMVKSADVAEKQNVAHLPGHVLRGRS